MNSSSLYKPRFKKEDLLKYTASAAVIIAERVAGIVSKEEAVERIRKVADKFTKKYGG